LLVLLFDYYASLNADGRISSMTMNEWGLFLTDFQLVDSDSGWCKRSDLDRVFIAVDTKTTHLAKAAADAAMKAGRRPTAGDANEMKALKRVEFMVAVVQVAVAKFVKAGVCVRVPEALSRLLVDWIDPQIDYDKFPDPNFFRRACYVESVSVQLAAHEPSLRLLHTALCELEFGAYAKRLGSKTWIAFMRAIDFILGADLSERDCNLCFVWARMAVSSTPGPKDDCLPFEGFMEALCRLAAIKALPTDFEIAEKGCEDAGKWVLLMTSDDDRRTEYQQLLRQRAVGWGGKPAQPLERCVSHTLSIIVRSMEATCNRGKSAKHVRMDGELSSSEVAMWCKLVGLRS